MMKQRPEKQDVDAYILKPIDTRSFYSNLFGAYKIEGLWSRSIVDVSRKGG